MSSDRVSLTVPNKGEYARTARLAAGELASRLEMSIDDVDDLKMAVEEAFVLVAGSSVADAVTFVFDIDQDAIEVLVGPMPEEALDDADSDASERYARFILEAVCDSFDYRQVAGVRQLHMIKRRA